MLDPGAPTLDQLQVFLAVVETGSFAAAARRQNRAVSAISYAIANLEAQLGLPLFDRHTTRKPQLTQAGRAVLAEARQVSRGVDDLKAKVRGLLQGLEAEVSLVVDVMFPTARLVDALQAFQAAFPTVTLRLHVEALGAVVQMLRDGTAGVGVSGPLPVQGEDLTQIAVGQVELIPVAAPFHPLARGQGQAPGAARGHVQLVLTDRSRLTEGRDFAVLSLNTWRLADLGAKHALLLAGIGWGNMPAYMVAGDIEAGRLVALKLSDYARAAYTFHALHRADAAPGPAARWLIARFLEQSDLAG
ncbi:LysR family transcriptional regulator [Caulobacter sp. KR2-114]|uniref:LysR family transcriptional regulator n=1 Tax=Caulobacter sp. KR2-114 TaxID=3400912 RepID=UPI003BFCA6F3